MDDSSSILGATLHPKGAHKMELPIKLLLVRGNPDDCHSNECPQRVCAIAKRGDCTKCAVPSIYFSTGMVILDGTRLQRRQGDKAIANRGTADVVADFFRLDVGQLTAVLVCGAVDEH